MLPIFANFKTCWSNNQGFLCIWNEHTEVLSVHRVKTFSSPLPWRAHSRHWIQSCDKAKDILPLFLQLKIRTGKCKQAFSNCDCDPLSETHLLCDAALPPELCIPGPHHLVLTTSGTTWRWKHFNHAAPTHLRAVFLFFFLLSIIYLTFDR